MSVSKQEGLRPKQLKDHLSLTQSQLVSLRQSKAFDEQTTTQDGASVADFRYKPSKRKLPPLHKKEIGTIIPSPVVNEKILQIRMNHLQRTIGKHVVQERIKECEKRKTENALKHRKRAYPNIKIPQSLLPNRYLRGELPCTIEHGTNGHYLSWACPLDNLDYEYYLPLFFDGLQCKEQPISFVARQGVEDMLFAAKSNPQKVIPCIKTIVRPLRNALSKFDTDVLLGVLKAIQQLLQVRGVGAELLPYAKQFLAPMAAFLECNKNIGDSIDYAQRRRDDVGEEVMLTLEMMEEHGGPRAFEQIKFCIPLYQSCLRPPDSHHHH